MQYIIWRVGCQVNSSFRHGLTLIYTVLVLGGGGGGQGMEDGRLTGSFGGWVGGWGSYLGMQAGLLGFL